MAAVGAASGHNPVSKSKIGGSNSFIASNNYQPAKVEPVKVNPFEEHTKQYPGGIFTA